MFINSTFLYIFIVMLILILVHFYHIFLMSWHIQEASVYYLTIYMKSLHLQYNMKKPYFWMHFLYYIFSLINHFIFILLEYLLEELRCHIFVTILDNQDNLLRVYILTKNNLTIFNCIFWFILPLLNLDIFIQFINHIIPSSVKDLIDILLLSIFYLFTNIYFMYK